MARIWSPGRSAPTSAGNCASVLTVGGSIASPRMNRTPVNTAIDRMKLNTGPAATVAERAQSGAPCIV